MLVGDLTCRRQEEDAGHALRWQGQCISAPAGAPKTPKLLDVLGIRGRLEESTKRALFRSAGQELQVTASPTRIVGGDTMSKRNQVIFEEGSVEARGCLQEQDKEFCRRLRIAIETGREFCPTTVFTEPCTSRPILNYMRPD